MGSRFPLMDVMLRRRGSRRRVDGGWCSRGSRGWQPSSRRVIRVWVAVSILSLALTSCRCGRNATPPDPTIGGESSGSTEDGAVPVASDWPAPVDSGEGLPDGADEAADIEPMHMEG